MKRFCFLTTALVLAMLLMAFTPGNGWSKSNPGGKPGPKEINNGEPSMEKVYFTNSVDLKYGGSADVTWSQPDKAEKVKILFSNNSIYYWYEWPAVGSRVPEIGLCRWTYLYDTDHEW